MRSFVRAERDANIERGKKETDSKRRVERETFSEREERQKMRGRNKDRY